ncbi:unnamed protein product [Rotaria sp. Silwood1]|nr:unnamed protein product [Rotaria sp. Silwood1]
MRTSPTSTFKSESWLNALNRRAFIDIAKSGSGKVNAFIWSAIVHMMTQIKHQVDDITIVLICAPQRELAEQLHLEYKQYEKPRNINSVGAFDSGNMHEQIMSCHKECEILVCAPNNNFANGRSRYDGGSGKKFVVGNCVQQERLDFGLYSGLYSLTTKTIVDLSNPFVLPLFQENFCYG